MGNDVTKGSITLNEAADQLGVHYMTAYRYVRTGRLRAHKDGGVWSVPIVELTAFTTQTAPPGQRKNTTPARLEARLVAGDEAGAYQIIDDARASGASLEEAYLDLLAPALVGVGSKWAEGVLTVADEHIATSIALRVIGRLGSTTSPRGRTKATILLASVQHDHHAVPTAILGDLLREQNFDVRDLGANTPPESLIERAASEPDLQAIGIAATKLDNEESIRDMLTRLDGAVEVPVILGGAAIRNRTHANSLGPCTPSTSAREALAIFKGMHSATATRS